MTNVTSRASCSAKNISDDLGPYQSFSSQARERHASVVMPGDVIIVIGGNNANGDVKVKDTADVLPPHFERERILFCPQNTNTNIFCSLPEILVYQPMTA